MSKQAFEHLLGYMIKAHKTQVKGLFCYIYTISGNSDLREKLSGFRPHSRPRSTTRGQHTQVYTVARGELKMH